MDINKIIAREKPNEKPVDLVMSLLGLTKSGAYKKLNGASKFSVEEVVTIFNTLDISFDQYFLSGQKEMKNYSFSTDTIKYRPRTYSEFWTQISLHLGQLVQDTNATAIYLANEIPIFYYLQFPKLMAFKLFVWDKTNWNISADNDRFSFNLIYDIPSLKEITQKVLDIYLSYPSIEVWNPNMFALTMMQLSYYTRAGVFKSADIIREIIGDLDKLMVFMKKNCESGKKSFFGQESSNNDVEIYLNELVFNSEMIFIKSDNQKSLYNKYDTPNYIFSDDQRVCNHIESWLDRIISKSTLISTRGKRDRDLFFKNAFDDLDIFQERTEGMIKTYF